MRRETTFGQQENIKLSVVVVGYEMERELPRTLLSLSPDLQLGVTTNEYEIIVVDNGSRRPPSLEALRSTGAPVRELILIENATPSPVPAINQGLKACRGDLIGVFVDGARMASPGLLRYALMAAQLQERVVVSPIAYHLGPGLQNDSIAQGYDQVTEDELLQSADWKADPYRLFKISSLAGSCLSGVFAPICESNALFMPRPLWTQLGGYDEQFISPGGGLANVDVYLRACELPDVLVVTLFGEGTFHQVHGGVATNALTHPWEEFHNEYQKIRGKPFETPKTDAVFFGRVPRAALSKIEESARSARNEYAVAGMDRIDE